MKLRNALFLSGMCLLLLAFRSDRWKIFRSETAKCSVMMPGVPAYQLVSNETDPGAPDMYCYMLDLEGKTNAENMMYGLIFSPLDKSAAKGRGPVDEETSELFDNVQVAVTAQLSGKLLQEKNIEYQGYPGREFEIDQQNGSVFTERLYIIEDRLYQLIVITDINKQYNSAIVKFFDSFIAEDI